MSKGIITSGSRSQKNGASDTTSRWGEVSVGLDGEATENGRARVSFLPSFTLQSLTYCNLVLSAEGILPEQSIVASGHSKVSVVRVDKTNIVYYYYVGAKGLKRNNLTLFLHYSMNVLVVEVLIFSSVCAIVYKGL